MWWVQISTRPSSSGRSAFASACPRATLAALAVTHESLAHPEFLRRWNVCRRYRCRHRTRIQNPRASRVIQLDVPERRLQDGADMTRPDATAAEAIPRSRANAGGAGRRLQPSMSIRDQATLHFSSQRPPIMSLHMRRAIFLRSRNSTPLRRPNQERANARPWTSAGQSGRPPVLR